MWPQVLALRFVDRVGKGIRTSPRDAMLAFWASERSRGLVYGFHRAMDHAGAIVGPLAATVFLIVYPGRYRALFALTALPGAIAVLLLTRVPEVRGQPVGAPIDDSSPWRELPAELYRYLFVLTVFTLGNSTDAFLLLRLTDAGGSPAMMPVLWALLHIVKFSFSIAGGSLSDRVGRRVVIVLGWLVYSIVYAGFATSSAYGSLVFWFLIYGLYFGMTEGVERALIADLAPPAVRGTAFGAYNAVVGVGALLASVLFGALWEAFGTAVAFGTGASLALLASILLYVMVPARARAIM